MNKKNIIIPVIIYFLSVGISFGALHFFLPTSNLISPNVSDALEEGVLVQVDPSAPKTEVCPINGQMFTKDEAKAWSERRPLLVMIENHHESRPQSGLQTADVVYEAVAEGGITRFMAVYYCDAITQDNVVGPVRSARTYFLDWASEYSKNPIYAHVGGANVPGKSNALGQIVDYGWNLENDLNQFSLTVNECWRDDSILKKANNVSYVPAEHTMQCSTEALWAVAAERGWEAESEDGDLWSDQFISWKFSDPKPVSNPSTTTISFDFWDDFTQYTVSWQYDSNSNEYIRSNGGSPHIDNITGEAIRAQVVVVQYVKETGPINDNKHMLYGTIGSGKAIVFQNGEAIKANWSKKTRTSRTLFTDEKGKDIEFARGKIWIEALPSDSTVDY